jgi:hypothetical protein
MLFQLVRKVLCSRQGKTRSNDTFDPVVSAGSARYSRRVRSQVDEQRRVTDGSTLLEILLEEPGSLHVDTHSGEDDGEVVLVAVVDTLVGSWALDQTGLTTDLGGNLVVRQT